MKARIIGTGSYLPEKVLTNQDLEKMVETTDEWIVSRTGMKERRIAADDESTSHMGLKAARAALANAGIKAEELDLILVATSTPENIFPAPSCFIQKELGATKAAAADFLIACAGYLYLLSTAKAFIESGIYKNILLVAAEKLSSVTDYKDRSTCILFGDGAAACVVSSEGKGLVLDTIVLGCDGEQSELITLKRGGFIQMSGNEVFKHAVRRMESACKECLEKAKLTEQQISWLIPHQANMRIIDAIAKRFEHLPPERIVKTVHKYGNTSASSVGIALDELLRKQPLKKEERVLLTAFGAGLSWGASILRAE